jgi:hypothetical protein
LPEAEERAAGRKQQYSAQPWHDCLAKPQNYSRGEIGTCMRLYPDSQGSVNYLFGQPPSLALEECLEA